MQKKKKKKNQKFIWEDKIKNLIERISMEQELWGPNKVELT